jgi:aminoglycoside phosphotransferase (APT) family kinase protein
MQQTILRNLNIQNARLLGEGIEAWIYALDRNRVVRIYKCYTPQLRAELTKLQAFYDSLHFQKVGFALPKILSIQEIDGILFTIDRRLTGIQLGRALAEQTPRQAQQFLQSYITLANDIAKLHEPFPYFGEILQENPLRQATWPEFIIQKTVLSYQTAKTQLDHDAPGLEEILAYIKHEVANLNPSAQLVHGDFNAMNVLVDHGALQALADFSSLTLAGDPRMDLASAVIGFLEGEDGMRKEDGEFIMTLLVDNYGDEIRHLIHLYRMYYALVFASYCKETDPRTYAWALRTFTEHLTNTYHY